MPRTLPYQLLPGDPEPQIYESVGRATPGLELAIFEPGTANPLTRGEVEASDEIKVLVIEGEGRAFCAGGDLQTIGAAAAADTIAPVVGELRLWPCGVSS